MVASVRTVPPAIRSVVPTPFVPSTTRPRIVPTVPVVPAPPFSPMPKWAPFIVVTAPLPVWFATNRPPVRRVTVPEDVIVAVPNAPDISVARPVPVSVTLNSMPERVVASPPAPLKLVTELNPSTLGAVPVAVLATLETAPRVIAFALELNVTCILLFADAVPVPMLHVFNTSSYTLSAAEPKKICPFVAFAVETSVKSSPEAVPPFPICPPARPARQKKEVLLVQSMVGVLVAVTVGVAVTVTVGVAVTVGVGLTVTVGVGLAVGVAPVPSPTLIANPHVSGHEFGAPGETGVTLNATTLPLLMFACSLLVQKVCVFVSVQVSCTAPSM